MRLSADVFDCKDLDTPLSVGGLVVMKPKPNLDDLLAALVTVLLAGALAAVRTPEPKLKPPVDAEPKPVNPVKPVNAPVCREHRTDQRA